MTIMKGVKMRKSYVDMVLEAAVERQVDDLFFGSRGHLGSEMSFADLEKDVKGQWRHYEHKVGAPLVAYVTIGNPLADSAREAVEKGRALKSADAVLSLIAEYFGVGGSGRDRLEVWEPDIIYKEIAPEDDDEPFVWAFYVKRSNRGRNPLVFAVAPTED